MPAPLVLHEDRLFPAEPTTRAIARRLFAQVKDLPIVSPHGHTNPQWFADDVPFGDPTSLLLIPDHYLFRMLYSQGVPMESMGIPRRDGGPTETDMRKAWKVLADNYHLFRGTPSRIWLDHVFATAFGLKVRLTPETADLYYDHIQDALKKPEFKPRALFERFGIELLSTTDSPLDDLRHHKKIRETWDRRVVPAYRPDNVADPEFEGFADNVRKLGEVAGEDATTWKGYIRALEKRRAYFKTLGCTSTDHGFPTARTADLDPAACEKLFAKALAGKCSAEEAELFRAQMLTEMARMSVADGLVMQLHPGSFRGHNPNLFAKHGRDMGADIPTATEYVNNLKPLLDRFGNEPNFTMILFTLDESTFGRELAPLAGHYPCLRLGPGWWFLDAPESMLRYRETVTETAGFYNTCGFNDDTRAFLSIPARHDLARRMDCNYLARLVAEHRIDEDEAADVAKALAYSLVKKAYKL